MAAGYDPGMPDPAANDLADNLAANLRYVRERRGLTQSELAKLSGIPRSTVGNIESGDSNPTLSVLAGIAGALQLSLEELLSTPRARCQLYPKGSLPIIKKGKAGRSAVHKLLPHPMPGMEIDRMELAPGERFTGVPHRPGTQEYLYCERGALTLWVMSERFELTAGDVVTFPGDQKHSYQNAGRTPAIGFSVVTLAPMPG